MDELKSASEMPDNDLTGYFSFALEKARRFYRLLIPLAAIFSLLSVLYVHMSEPIYTAVAALTPPPRDALVDAAAGLQGTSGTIGGLTRRLGIGGVGSAGDELFDRYTRLLQSYRLAGVLAARPDFMKLAFPDRYDPATTHLRQGGGGLVRQLKGILGLPQVTASDQDQVYLLLKQNLNVAQPRDPTTNISEVTFRFTDGPAAQEILGILLDEADGVIRSDKRRDVAARIAYLQKELSNVTLGDARQSLISLLAIQQNTMMALSADRTYASSIVETPHSPVKPTWPTPGSLIGLVAFLTFGAWAILIFALAPGGRFLRLFDSRHALFSRAPVSVSAQG